MANLFGRYTTHDEVKQAVLENVDWDLGNGDVDKADKFIAAARAWLIINPSRAVHGGRGSEEIVLNSPQVAEMLKRAEAFRSQVIGEEVLYYDLTEYRS